MPSSQTLAISCGRNQYAELPARVASAMRVEPVVVAARATAADRDATDATLACMVSDQRSQIDVASAFDRAPGQPLEYIRADLITAPADRGTQMHDQLVAWDPTRLEEIDRTLDDSAGGAAPTRV